MKPINTHIHMSGLLLTAFAGAVQAAPAQSVAVEVKWPAISMFIAFVFITLLITYRSSRRAKSAADFYAAGGSITPLQNGLAIAGDFMSAAAFLGLSALFYTSGFDAWIYALGFAFGWPVVLLLVAERLRNLGLYTISDVTAYRLDPRRVRVLTASASLVVILFYMVAQMVGAGKVIQLLFGLNYQAAVMIVCVLTVLYVSVGGMHATTWVQIMKACLLLVGALLLTFIVLQRFDFNVEAIFRSAIEVHPKGSAIMNPGPMISDPVSAISLSLALIFGTSGLPHILMRFYTVPNANDARKSVFYATCFITSFSLILPIIGFGAIAILMKDPRYFVDGDLNNRVNGLIGGANMVALHLADVVGGPVLFGFIGAVAFATILAVVSGLTLAAASAVSHDLYGQVVAKGAASEDREVMVSKISAIGIGIIAAFLSLAFENQNVAFMVGLALSVAASCNFPVLLMSLYWKDMTTRGAVAGGVLGLGSAVILVILSKTVWVAVLHFAMPIFPYESPTIFSMPLAFLGIWAFSRMDTSARARRERAAFNAQWVRSETGIHSTSQLTPVVTPLPSLEPAN